MAGMTKAQAKKAKKRQPELDAYQRYLSLVKRGGKSALQKAMTQYGWMQATPRARQTAMRVARSN